jgi:hypothetical protein
MDETPKESRLTVATAAPDEAARRARRPGDETEAILLGFEDAAERRQAPEAARQHREWLQVTLDSIGDAVIATDAEGVVTCLNPAAESLTGCGLAEAGRAVPDPGAGHGAGARLQHRPGAGGPGPVHHLRPGSGRDRKTAPRQGSRPTMTWPASWPPGPNRPSRSPAPPWGAYACQSTRGSGRRPRHLIQSSSPGPATSST